MPALLMYGIPSDLQLERLVGQQFNFIGVGRFQIQFHVTNVVEIHVEGGWELRDAEGALVDSDREHADRDSYCIHRIIHIPINRFSLDAPRSFTLFFESGHSLAVYDNSEMYECLSVHFTGEPSHYI